MATTPPYDALASLLAACSVTLGDTELGSPARALVVDTDPDWEDCCGPDFRGRLAVWGEAIFPFRNFPGQDPQMARTCVQIYALNAVAQILRCAESRSDDDWQNMTRLEWADAWAMAQAACALVNGGRHITVTNIGVVGEEGGCRAVEMRLVMALR
jgi:hypothetical protein